MSGGGAGGGGVAVECRSPRGAPPHQHRLTVRCLSVCLWEFWHILRLPLAASNNPADLCAAPLPFWPFIFQRVWFNQQVTIFSVENFGSYNWSRILLINGWPTTFFGFVIKGRSALTKRVLLVKYKVWAPTLMH